MISFCARPDVLVSNTKSISASSNGSMRIQLLPVMIHRLYTVMMYLANIVDQDVYFCLVPSYLGMLAARSLLCRAFVCCVTGAVGGAVPDGSTKSGSCCSSSSVSSCSSVLVGELLAPCRRVVMPLMAMCSAEKILCGWVGG